MTFGDELREIWNYMSECVWKMYPILHIGVFIDRNIAQCLFLYFTSSKQQDFYVDWCKGCVSFHLSNLQHDPLGLLAGKRNGIWFLAF